MPIPELRESARRIWQAAIAAADPFACVSRALAGAAPDEPAVVIGAGKAVVRMAAAVEAAPGLEIRAGLVVTKHGHGAPLDRIAVLEAGHPLPDADGLDAVRQTRELLRGRHATDHVICLISGGASSLWPAPAGISLDDKRTVTNDLQNAGAGIRELNSVRKHLSEIKGGQLVRWTAPARVLTLILSDVVGDPIEFIGAGPTAPDSTTFADALAVVGKYGLRLPPAVEKRLAAGIRGEIPETPKPGDPMFAHVANRLVGGNELLAAAAREAAEQEGFEVAVLSTALEGEARHAAERFKSEARRHRSRPTCVLAAGETTVTVRGTGLGGRNQEMALAWALGMDPQITACFASIGSDGTDGPTDAAGGLVDSGSAERMRAAAVDPVQALDNNDSYHALAASGDLIRTGPTGTNVMDLQILLVAPPE